MQYRILTLLFGLFIFYQTHGNDTIDSLLIQLDNCADSSKYTLITKLADAYYYDSQLEISASYYKKAANLAELDTPPNYRRLSESYGNYGYCLHEMGRYAESITNYTTALSYAQQKFDSTEIATQHNNMGISYFLMGHYEKSLDHYRKALSIDNALKRVDNVGIDYSVLGNVLATWNKHNEAIIFFRNALDIAREINNQEQISIRLNKLGSSYIALQNYDSALIFLNGSLSISEIQHNNSRIAMTLNQIGFAQQRLKNNSLAMDYYQKALARIDESVNFKNVALIHVNICENYLELEQYEEAELHGLLSLENGLDIGLSNSIIRSYELLAKIKYAKGDFKKAFEYQELYAAQKDSAFTSESQKKLAEFRVVHETEKKDNEIKLLNSENLIQEIQINKASQRFYFLMAITILLIILISLGYYQYMTRKKINSLLSEKNQQLQQLNSTKDRFISIIAHDLKNPFYAFSNISSALFNKKDLISESEKDQFIGSIYQSSLKLKELLNSLLDWARLQKNNLDVKMELLNLREIAASSIEFNGHIISAKKINIVNEVDDTLSLLSNKNTLLSVLNNLLTNAVKFSDARQKVTFSSIRQNNHINLIVEDSGIGLSVADTKQLFKIDVDTRKIGNSPEKGTGMGLILCDELLQKIKGKISVESVLGKGSKFIVSLPLDENDIQVN